MRLPPTSAPRARAPAPPLPEAPPPEVPPAPELPVGLRLLKVAAVPLVGLDIAKNVALAGAPAGAVALCLGASLPVAAAVTGVAGAAVCLGFAGLAIAGANDR